jgi:hypothetical protein
MILQSAKEEQSAEARVLPIKSENILRDRSKNSLIVRPRTKPVLDFVVPLRFPALLFEKGPVEVVLSWEVPKNDRLVHAGTFRDLARGGPFKALPRE